MTFDWSFEQDKRHTLQSVFDLLHTRSFTRYTLVHIGLQESDLNFFFFYRYSMPYVCSMQGLLSRYFFLNKGT